MFSYAAILAAVAPEHVPAHNLEIDLPQLDPGHRIGIGRDGEGAFVLVGPGQAIAPTLKGLQFSFDPWKELADRRSGVVLRDVCVLRFRPGKDEAEMRTAVSAVFAGLVELTLATPHALGDAILAMEGLFESGLKSALPPDKEIGLAGELLAIAESAHPSVLASMWHTKADGRFDFSAQGERLEVKTTTRADRVHWFSSGQLGPIPGVCTSFTSIILPLVEVGSTVASVFASLSELSADQKARVRSVIIDTAKAPPEVLTSVVFDRDAARESMLHLASDCVPTPVTVPGVGRMRWEAILASDAPRPANGCAFITSLGF